MALIKLSAENFIDQIVDYGYFSEQIPTCFNTKSLLINLSSILPLIKCDNNEKKAKNTTTAPVTLSTYKNDISRRVLSFPNPHAFLRLVKLMAENWNEIKEAAESKNSLSPITYVHSYQDVGQELLNSEKVRDINRSKSDFLDGLRKCIRISLGYKFQLKLDISNCYASIYSHSIAWAMCGKEKAKQYLRTKEPSSLKQKYELADRLDTFTRFQKNNETNGIVIGPFTSRIFSEIVFSELDRLLTKKGYHFRRYVDDYKFYFRSEAQAQESIPIIERILNEYNLNLNTEKSEISRYPYETISPMRHSLEEALKRGKVLEALNTASRFHAQGEVGAYKYVLKLIKEHDIPADDTEEVISILINILLVDPKYGKYIVPYLNRNLKKYDIETLSNIFNQELSSSLKNELQEESLLFIYIIRQLKLNLSPENLTNIILGNNDFSIIIALDLWKNRNKSIKRSKAEATKINKSIETLASLLKGEEYNGSRWLLLYEIRRHKLIPESIIPKPKQDAFFEKLMDEEITFYQSIK